MWQTIWTALCDDLGRIDLALVTQLVLRLGTAAIVGGVVGYDRERHGKEAGLRTHMLVALGAALFVIVPQQSGMTDADLSRVIQPANEDRAEPLPPASDQPKS